MNIKRLYAAMAIIGVLLLAVGGTLLFTQQATEQTPSLLPQAPKVPEVSTPLLDTIPLSVPTPHIYDLSRRWSKGYLEFCLSAVGETLVGQVYVTSGSVVFVLTDTGGRHFVDLVVKPGESYTFALKAKQSGARYRCWFTYETGMENEPRAATFSCSHIAEGWR